MKPVRVLIAKPGLDGHDRGAKVIARGLRDAGMEVIYTGLRQTSALIVSAAVQEDVDAIGLSVLSGAHMRYFREVSDLLRAEGSEDIVLFGGGIIPGAGLEELHGLGARKLFTPGTTIPEVVGWLQETVRPGAA